MNLDSALQLVPDVFSATYDEARKRFLAAVGRSTAYLCSSKGPAGEDLFTDAAYFGDPDARKVLVLISGTHGPEGYCGSAAQLAFLRAGLAGKLRASTGVLMIHALNCYGFAWDRRVTAEGCDLNRNFIDFTQPVPPNPGYEELADVLVPEDRSEEGLTRTRQSLAAYRARVGDQALKAARSQGQYTHPTGLFYGGSGPTNARRTLERIAGDHRLADRERVIVIDYHTGLGPYGYGELQCEQVSGLDGYDRAFRIFGASVTSPDLGSSSSAAIYGCQDDYWERLLGDRHVYCALEFGTYTVPPERSVLTRDAWLFRYQPQEADTALGREVRKATKDHFYPAKADWQEMVITRVHQVHRQALDAFG
ncbi:MAG: DUF2817 domain-containing protein [Lautropia sp.]